ncbi:MAG: LamG domain-containing protein [Chlorobiota bacterium]
MRNIVLALIATVVFMSCSDDTENPTDNDDKDPEVEITHNYKKYYAYYPFDGDLADSSDSDYDGIANGAIFAPDRFDSANAAIYFDGSSHVNLPYPGMLDFDGDFAVAFWAKVGEQKNITEAGHFDLIGNAIWFKGGWFVGVNTFEQYQTMTWLREDVGERIAYDKETYFDEEWHHIVYNYDRISDEETLIKLYIDGEEKMAKQTNTPSHMNYIPNIGARVDLTSYFTGTIDDLVIHDELITKADIDSLMGNY